MGCCLKALEKRRILVIIATVFFSGLRGFCYV